jgi:hypothetical protein
MGRHVGLLSVKHHLLVGPLSELSAVGVKVGRLGLLGIEQGVLLLLLVRMVRLVKRRVKGLGRDGGCPSALRLLGRVRLEGLLLMI